MERTTRPVAEKVDQMSVEQEMNMDPQSASPQTPRLRVSASSPAQLRPGSTLSPAKGRRAFTLVELLMVIVIIGILVALVTLAVGGALKKANQTRVLTEINQLSTAIESYRQKHGSYPPNPGTEPADETTTQREQRFMRHIRRAFPRYTGNLAQLRIDLQNATDETDQDHPAAFNINTMDAAETLVFFLGGVPNRNESTWLNGFAADAQNPFQRVNRHPDDAPADDPPDHPFQRQRTARFFEFDPTRLRDYDQDGWPEYVPNLNSAVVDTAPYVYFDAGSYELGSHYPFTHFNPTPAPTPDPAVVLPGLWGFAVPYGRERDETATTDDPQDATSWTMRSWQAPGKFQIICAGLDGQYGGRNDPLSPPVEGVQRIVPSGQGYKHFNGATPPPGYLDLDSDNLTNFSESPIGDIEDPEAQ